MIFFWKRPKKMYGIALDKLVNDIKEMLNQNQLTMEHYHAERLKMLFDNDGTPKKVRCQTGTNSCIEIPLFMLTNHRVMQLNEMKISLPITAESIKAKLLEVEQDNSQGDYTVTFSQKAKDKGRYSVEILFRLKEDKK